MVSFVIMKIARQYDGEYVWMTPEKAFTAEDKDRAEFAAMKWVNANPTGAVEMFKTPQGQDVQCLIERGIFEVEVEELK